jgi:3-dehydroquinate synthase
MDAIPQQPIQVTFDYPVLFTHGLFAAGNPILRDVLTSRAGADGTARVLVVIDSGVAAATGGLTGAIARYAEGHHDAMALAGPAVIVPGGETAKNDPAVLDRIHRAINDARLCRHSYVAAIGGGAVLDVVGYAAATAHRGIRLIRIPTTVLAQDDSAVGVKNGVNAFGKKNYLGTFAPPFAVINDFDFLTTLSERDWRAGISEAIKVAIVRDPAFFEALEADAPRLMARDPAAMERLVRRSAALHLAHIAGGGDPFELGSSRPLDFGHWSAHKLEQMTGYRLRHGEAVAIGMALDSAYAHEQGFLPRAALQRILDLLVAVGFDLLPDELAHAPEPTTGASVLDGLEEFREHLGGTLTIMLLRGLGQPFDVHEIDRDAMMRSIGVLARAQDAARTASAPRRAS